MSQRWLSFKQPQQNCAIRRLMFRRVHLQGITEALQHKMMLFSVSHETISDSYAVQRNSSPWPLNIWLSQFQQFVITSRDKIFVYTWSILKSLQEWIGSLTGYKKITIFPKHTHMYIHSVCVCVCMYMSADVHVVEYRYVCQVAQTGRVCVDLCHGNYLWGKVRAMSNLEQQLERLLPAASLGHICFPERESLLGEES